MIISQPRLRLLRRWAGRRSTQAFFWLEWSGFYGWTESPSRAFVSWRRLVHSISTLAFFARVGGDAADTPRRFKRAIRRHTCRRWPKFRSQWHPRRVADPLLLISFPHSVSRTPRPLALSRAWPERSRRGGNQQRFAEMSTRLEVECPHRCDVFPIEVGVIEELEVMEITEVMRVLLLTCVAPLAIHSGRISKHRGLRRLLVSPTLSRKRVPRPLRLQRACPERSRTGGNRNVCMTERIGDCIGGPFLPLHVAQGGLAENARVAQGSSIVR